MKFYILTFIFISALLTITACSISSSSDISSTPTLSTDSSDVTLETIAITGTADITLYPMQTKQLFLNATLTNDKIYHGITQTFNSMHNHLDENVLWYTNDALTAGLSKSGLIIGRKQGTTTIIASLSNKTAMVTVTVAEKPVVDPSDESDSDMSDLSDKSEEEEPAEETQPTEEQEDDTEPEPEPEPETELTPEEPNNPVDSFLSSNDNITLNLGSNSGFGFDNYPDVIYGAPGGTMDVLSLGNAGSITIVFNNYIIMNGDGIDFTIFENPFTGWEECAEVSVSDDGINYYTFICDQMDDDGNGLYEGCAGKDPVSIGLSDDEYRDPSLSGGDQFDLDDLGLDLETVKYMMITDIGLCGSTASVPSGTSAGFDFDALAIINGINE
jgi:hypothetical protein